MLRVLRKTDMDCTRRAGELTEDEVERMITIMQNPSSVLGQKDMKDRKYSQLVASGLDNKFPEDLKQLKKIWAHRRLHHFWALRVPDQHTKIMGHRGCTVHVPKK